MKFLDPIPQEYQHLASDFDEESRVRLRSLLVISFFVVGVIYALFSFADYWFYPEVVQRLLLSRWFMIMILFLTAAFLYRRKEFKSIYGISFIVLVASALLTESLLIISRDPIGPYLVAYAGFMLWIGILSWPAKWMIYSNLSWLLIFMITPSLFGVIEDWPRFIFYCAMIFAISIASAALHIILTRLR